MERVFIEIKSRDLAQSLMMEWTRNKVEELSDQENVSSPDEKTSTTKSMKRKNQSDGKSFHRKNKHRINSLSDDGMDKKEVEELSVQENVSSHDEKTCTTTSIKRRNPTHGKSFHRNKKQRFSSESDDGMDKKQVEELSDQENVSHDEKTSTTKSIKRTNLSHGKSFHRNNKHRINSDDGVENDDTELEEMRKNDEKTLLSRIYWNPISL
jgi:hypothetical protein